MSTEVPPQKLSLYKALIDAHPNIELKGGSKLPYTSLNGNMYTLMTKEGRVALRMGREDRDVFIEKYDTKLCEQYDTVMKEYVEVPDTLLTNLEELIPYLEMSYTYAQSLKPKKTKKKK